LTLPPTVAFSLSRIGRQACRACELADGGKHSNWTEIADALEAAGVANARALLGADYLLTVLLYTRCERAKHRLSGVASRWRE